METYKNQIASNAKVELIMASLDSTEDAAAAWAEEAQFPWPTVMKEDLAKTDIMEHQGRGVPHYVLVNKEGEALATGKEACLAKIAELSE